MSATILFYLYAVIAVAGALGLVGAHKLLHGVVSLLATLVAVGALYLLLGMEFLAAMQLFVYGGAITVLVMFALMLAGPRAENAERVGGRLGWIAGVVCLTFFVAMVAVILQTGWQIAPVHVHDTASIAKILFSRYVLPFEIAGLSLTIALIGAIVIARQDHANDDRGAAETAAASPAAEAGVVAE